MKEIRIALEDSEYAVLKKAKGILTWKEFLMSGGKRRDGNETRNNQRNKGRT